VAEQLDLFRRSWLIRTHLHNRAHAPEGDGHLYEAESARDAVQQHDARRRTGRFPWLGFALSVTLAEAPPDGPRW
jgi:hypothetical protein